MNEFYVELKLHGDSALDIWDDIEQRIPGAKVQMVKHLREPGEPGQLPIILMDGKKYFQDDRCRQFRSVAKVGEPIEFIDYDDAL